MYPTAWLSRHSLYFECFFRHQLLADLMRALLLSGSPQRVTILSAEVDSEGYDLVLSCGASTGYVQFKVLGKGTTSVKYTIKASLADLPGACVLWLCYDEATLRTTHYHLLAGEPGDPLGSLLPTSTAQRKRNGEVVARHGYVHVRIKDANHPHLGIDELAVALFGPLDAEQ